MENKKQKLASQVYDPALKVLKLDLHGCSLLDAERIVPSKLRECYETGTRALLIVYGRSSQDLGNSVHKALAEPALESCFHSKKTFGVAKGKYFRVPNGSPEDVAVLAFLECHPSPKRTHFSGFTATYSGDVAGISLADTRTHTSLSASFVAFPRPSDHGTKRAGPRPKRKTMPKPSPPPKKQVVFPREWLGKPNQKRPS